jgi:tRNA nucleotidyltransferase (CCA-adding enzyme)
MLAIVLGSLDAEEAQAAVTKLSMPKDEQQAVLSARSAVLSLATEPIETWSPEVLHKALSPLGAAAVAALGVAGNPRARRALVDYWARLRPVTLSVDGKDLKALGLPPGPRYGEILQEVMNARLRGMIHTPEEERALLERLAADAREETRPC